jgi:hypothetical protein
MSDLNEPLETPNNPEKAQAMTDHIAEEIEKGSVSFEKSDWAKDIPSPKERNADGEEGNQV